VDKLPVEAGATPAIVGFTLWQKASFDVTAGPRRESAGPTAPFSFLALFCRRP